MFSNSRGNFGLEVLVIFIGALVVGVTGIVMLSVMQPFESDVVSDAGNWSNQSVAIVQNDAANYAPTVDGAVGFFFAILMAGGIASAMLIDVFPAFVFLSLILSVFVVIAGLAMQTSYYFVSQDADLVTQSAQFAITNWIFGHALLITVAYGALLMAVLYGKSRG